MRVIRQTDVMGKAKKTTQHIMTILNL